MSNEISFTHTDTYTHSCLQVYVGIKIFKCKLAYVMVSGDGCTSTNHLVQLTAKNIQRVKNAEFGG